jgi:hypothetical protein
MMSRILSFLKELNCGIYTMVIADTKSLRRTQPRRSILIFIGGSGQEYATNEVASNFEVMRWKFEMNNYADRYTAASIRPAHR